MIQISRFFIIQSLKGERRAGDEVFQQMTFATLKADLKDGFRPILQLYDVDSKTELFNLLNQIANDTKNGIEPLLHFEMHGRKEGIELSDDTVVKMGGIKRTN